MGKEEAWPGDLASGRAREQNGDEVSVQTLPLCLKFLFRNFKCVDLPSYSPRTSGRHHLRLQNHPAFGTCYVLGKGTLSNDEHSALILP